VLSINGDHKCTSISEFNGSDVFNDESTGYVCDGESNLFNEQIPAEYECDGESNFFNEEFPAEFECDGEFIVDSLPSEVNGTEFVEDPTILKNISFEDLVSDGDAKCIHVDSWVVSDGDAKCSDVERLPGETITSMEVTNPNLNLANGYDNHGDKNQESNLRCNKDLESNLTGANEKKTTKKEGDLLGEKSSGSSEGPLKVRYIKRKFSAPKKYDFNRTGVLDEEGMDQAQKDGKLKLESITVLDEQMKPTTKEVSVTTGDNHSKNTKKSKRKRYGRVNKKPRILEECCPRRRKR